MKRYLSGIVAALIVFSFTAHADPWKDESGNGQGGNYRDNRSHEYKTEYRDGRCRIEKKWEGNGEYKEERKCKGYNHGNMYHEYDGRDPAIVISTPDIVIKP